MKRSKYFSSQPTKTPEYYLSALDPAIRDSLNAAQMQAITDVLAQAIPKPAPKLVDLRFGIDVIINRFYVVLLVGPDRRHQNRTYVPTGRVAQMGNRVAAILLLISLNLTLSAVIGLSLYLLKSALGIDFLTGHISETLANLLKP
jgi:hypothetical protein